MQYRKFLWVVMLIVFLLCGCTNQMQSDATGSTKTQSETTGTTDSQSETAEASPTEVPEEKAHPDMVECAFIEGFVTADSKNSNTSCQIYLKKHRNNQTDYISYDLYIEVDTGSQVLKKMLESCVTGPSEDYLFLGDVDGDGIPEILVHNNTGGVGGFGLWCTWVLKVEGNEIRILFENFNEFDTGFESRFLDGYQMEIKNHFTDYTLVFDVKEGHRKYLTDSKELPDGKIHLDPFYVFEPKDVDNDGISEILCKQYTSYMGHADYTGTACSVLKYNRQTQVFEVIDAWYEPYIPE